MPPHSIEESTTWVRPQHEKAMREQHACSSSSDGSNSNTNNTSIASTSRCLKSVSFQTHITYREIAPLVELSKDEIQEVWYKDEEYVKMKKHVSATVKKANKGQDVYEDKGYCMRGLEGRTRFGAKRRKNHKARALDAVWSTQLSQWQSKTNNPAAIAAAYRPHSVRSRYPAMENAKRDEKFVNEWLRTTTSE